MRKYQTLLSSLISITWRTCEMWLGLNCAAAYLNTVNCCLQAPAPVISPLGYEPLHLKGLLKPLRKMNMYSSPSQKTMKGMGTNFWHHNYWDCLGLQEILMIGPWYSRQPLTNHKKRYACHPKCSQKLLHQKFVPILLVVSGVGNPRAYKQQFTVCNLA